MKVDYTKLLWESFKYKLVEGGWRMPSLTSNTPLTPEVVDRSMEKLKSLFSQFESWIKENPTVKITKRGSEREIRTYKSIKLKGASGSTYYYKIDKESGNKVTYGDIDVNVVIPVFIDEKDPKKEREEELWNLSAYKEQLRKFILNNTPAEVSSEWISNKRDEIGNQPYLILDLGNGEFVQIDLIYSFEHSESWDSMRSRPERGLKGFVTGLWFSSIAETLDISLGMGKLPFYRPGKSKENIVKNLFVEIVIEKTGMKSPDVSDLRGYEGISVENFTFEYLINATKRLGISLEKNGVMKYSSFIGGVKSKFAKKMRSHLASPKFKSVLSGRGSKEEKDSYDRTVKDVKRGIEIVKSVLSESVSENRLVSIFEIKSLPEPIFVLTSGGIGVGKSFVVDKYLKGFLVVDVDQEKSMLTKGDINSKELITPSVRRAMEKFKLYLNSKDNIVYQGISPNINGIKNKMRLAKENGYTTVLLRVVSDASTERVRNRISAGGHGRLGAIGPSIEKSKHAFDEIKNSKLIDYVSIYKN